MCSEIRRNPPGISKGILQNSISRFESWHPSGPLCPFSPVSGLLQKSRPFRGLARRQTVSAAKQLAFARDIHVFLRSSLWSRFFDIQVSLLENRFENTETRSRSQSQTCNQAAGERGGAAVLSAQVISGNACMIEKLSQDYRRMRGQPARPHRPARRADRPSRSGG